MDNQKALTQAQLNAAAALNKFVATLQESGVRPHFESPAGIGVFMSNFFKWEQAEDGTYTVEQRPDGLGQYRGW